MFDEVVWLIGSKILLRLFYLYKISLKYIGKLIMLDLNNKIVVYKVVCFFYYNFFVLNYILW